MVLIPIESARGNLSSGPSQAMESRATVVVMQVAYLSDLFLRNVIGNI
jgi:hypothetical protein